MIDITSATATASNSPNNIDPAKVAKSGTIFDVNRCKYIQAFIGFIFNMVTCPISWQFMKDPCLAPDKCFYDKDNIEK